MNAVRNLMPEQLDKSSRLQASVQTARPRIRVVHLTTGHRAQDNRIFEKECRTLAAAGYQVTLIAPHQRDEITDGVQVRAIPVPKGRLSRLTGTAAQACRQALLERAAAYHFHDPELIPAGILLKLMGRKVIYDAHEAYPDKIRSHPAIPKSLRRLTAGLFRAFEYLASRTFDHIVTADAPTAHSFGQRGVTSVANYPLLERIGAEPPIPRKQPPFVLIYVGALTKARGLDVMLDVARRLEPEDVQLHLLGKFRHSADETRALGLPNVRYFGLLDLKAMYRHVKAADIGVVLLQPCSAYFYAGENTTKLFDYMGCGIPVVASDFPNLRQLIQQLNCGLCVDPTDVAAISESVLRLLKDPSQRRAMGLNGRRAVLSTCNWERESAKLLTVYEQVCSRNGAPAGVALARDMSDREGGI